MPRFQGYDGKVNPQHIDMATEIPSLDRFAPWLRRTDPHASFRLPLLEEAEQALAAPSEGEGPTPLRHALAAKLERWRYQHLNERRGQFEAEDRQLADALDLAANALAGRAPRRPRATRWLIHDSARDTASMREALDCFDRAVDLEEVIRRARELTIRHFSASRLDSTGASKRRIAMYAPLYLSSHCVNHCTYCGFRYPNQIKRRHLAPQEALREAEILASRGFRQVLLVAGDFPRLTTAAYFAEIIAAMRERGLCPTIEIAPQSTAAYAELVAAGVRGMTLYQETYDERLYARYHPRGSKSSFDWRLEAHDRAAEAGMPQLGLGVLLGLADPREDVAAMMRHALDIQARFPDRVVAFSLPRIREAPGGFHEPYRVDDELFVRLYCGLRIAFPRADLVLSTRESVALRNRLAAICITRISAGSCTSPGGYEESTAAEHLDGQFPVCDQRSPAEVAGWLAHAGFEVVWDATQSVRPPFSRPLGMPSEIHCAGTARSHGSDSG